MRDVVTIISITTLADGMDLYRAIVQKRLLNPGYWAAENIIRFSCLTEVPQQIVFACINKEIDGEERLPAPINPNAY